ncbi:dUTPase [Spraguea lophii 42_110]|uniref:Deoxyuridine 5'-triphosphate nucleotidohydrolase n=1 Tax=Spraguea lophii (strain 42_110) TaxID=1358809 RepID=S7W9J6_SPRLO|nr:dUTPase [Spraguea lophii 42_110]
MKIKASKLSSNTIIPKQESDGAAGFDLRSIEDGIIPPKSHKLIRTGLVIDPPRNILPIVFSRSGLALKNKIHSNTHTLSNKKQEVIINMFNGSNKAFNYNVGDRIAQLVFCELENADN